MGKKKPAPLEALCSIAPGMLMVYLFSREEQTRPQKVKLRGMVKHTDFTRGLRCPGAEHWYGLGVAEVTHCLMFALLLPSSQHGQDPGTPAACGVPGLFLRSAKQSNTMGLMWRSHSTAKLVCGHPEAQGIDCLHWKGSPLSNLFHKSHQINCSEHTPAATPPLPDRAKAAPWLSPDREQRRHVPWHHLWLA